MRKIYYSEFLSYFEFAVNTRQNCRSWETISNSMLSLCLHSKQLNLVISHKCICLTYLRWFGWVGEWASKWISFHLQEQQEQLKMDSKTHRFDTPKHKCINTSKIKISDLSSLTRSLWQNCYICTKVNFF